MHWNPELISRVRCSTRLPSMMHVRSDGHDKPFCIKAITIIDNFKKALGDTDNR